MYKTFEIKNFRGIKKLKLDSFRKINLITGSNNIGKTAVLEAIFIHSGAYNPDLSFRVNATRGLQNAEIDLDREDVSPWDSLFFNYNSKTPISLSTDLAAGGWEIKLSHVTQQTEISGLSLSAKQALTKTPQGNARINAKALKLEHKKLKGGIQRYFLLVDREGKKHLDPSPPPSPFPSRLHIAGTRADPKEQAAHFARIQISGTKDQLLKSLTVLEPRLTDIELVMEAGEPMLHGSIGIEGHRLIPLSLMGDGVNRLASILLMIAISANGILMVDEIEIGWHYSMLPKIWQAIRMALDSYNVQLFCTTHSRECVSAAFEAMQSISDFPLAVYRLERGEEEIRAVTYDKDALEYSFEQNFEIR